MDNSEKLATQDTQNLYLCEEVGLKCFYFVLDAVPIGYLV